MPKKGDRHVATQRLDDILACGPDFILACRDYRLRRIASHLGLSGGSLNTYVTSETELIRLICARHLNEAFDAVCLPNDWHGTPIEVLRAMGLALLAYAQGNAARHLVFLLYRHTLDEPARNANDTLLTYLTNNVQLALHAITPEKPFATLQSPARMFLGQIMHLPLWWPPEPDITKDEWVCHEIGRLAGTAPPDWRQPPATRA